MKKIVKIAPKRDASIDCVFWAEDLPLKLYQLAEDKEKMFLGVDEPAVPVREVQSGQCDGWFAEAVKYMT